MSPRLTLGYSPCPNDTFIFYALTHGLVPLEGVEIVERLEDVETLNRLAMDAVLDLTKISYHALGHLRQEYCLLRSGSALGRGCGPLVIATEPSTMAALKGRTIAIPGRLTTANLLLQLYGEGYDDVLVLPFDRIMDALREGRADAGVIIHESRFTYFDQGFVEVCDLGAWWESETALPIPLGGILARRDLGPALISRIDAALLASLDYARAHPDEPGDYIRRHAQELSGTVTDQHIQLYVNDFSRDLGEVGIRAVEALLDQAEKRGLIPHCDLPLFLS
ncbi:MAG: 1,4-dihydroxy-6-naphthoate synthase [Desulfuromonadales bacterium]